MLDMGQLRQMKQGICLHTRMSQFNGEDSHKLLTRLRHAAGITEKCAKSNWKCG